MREGRTGIAPSLRGKRLGKLPKTMRGNKICKGGKALFKRAIMGALLEDS